MLVFCAHNEGTVLPELVKALEGRVNPPHRFVLTEAGITHVAMESTCEYCRPVYNPLEGNFTIFLVNAAHVKQVPGRKTDKADARWLAKLMRYGLLQGSVIPPAGQRDLRDLTRYRTKLVQERSREVIRVQGVLERANIKLGVVATDIMGVATGLSRPPRAAARHRVVRFFQGNQLLSGAEHRQLRNAAEIARPARDSATLRPARSPLDHKLNRTC
jgi:transposase